MRLVGFLGYQRWSANDDVWLRERREKADLWLHALRRLEKQIDPNFDMNDRKNRPSLKVYPPEETNLPPRMACPDAELLVPWRDCRTIGQAVVDLQGKVSRTTADNIPQIIIGDVEGHERSDFAVRATFDGWRGGVVPIDDGIRLDELTEFTPAGVLTGAVGVSEAFQYVRGSNTLAGHRAVGLSLWQPDSGTAWLDDRENGPQLKWLPSSCWLIGLGHLGQAYLWTLGFLPYANPGAVHLVLQDYDDLVLANDSTSLLTNGKLIGQKKTRAMTEWCEQRGFHTRINERWFAGNCEIDEEEPQVALCGVDNESARAALEDVGFAQIIEADSGAALRNILPSKYIAFLLSAVRESVGE